MTAHLSRTEIVTFFEGLPPRPDADTPDLSNDVIACTGELSEIAGALGRDLGRPVVGVRPPDHWLRPARPFSSVLVLGLRREFSAETARMWVESSLRYGVPLGFLLVDDRAEARFQAAKPRLAHTRVLPGADAVVDPLNGVCSEPGEAGAARPERLRSVLSSPCRTG